AGGRFVAALLLEIAADGSFEPQRFAGVTGNAGAMLNQQLGHARADGSQPDDADLGLLRLVIRFRHRTFVGDLSPYFVDSRPAHRPDALSSPGRAAPAAIRAASHENIRDRTKRPCPWGRAPTPRAVFPRRLWRMPGRLRRVAEESRPLSF